MFDELTAHILKRLEAFPDATFRESELVSVSKESFETLVKDGDLVFDRYDQSGDSYCSDRMGDGDNERVLRIKDSQISAFSPDPDVATIQLTKPEITYYRFDQDHLLQEIKSKNNLSGTSDKSFSDRILYVGVNSTTNTAVFLGFFDDEVSVTNELLALKNKIDKYEACLVLCPSYWITSQGLLNKCAELDIVCLPFKDAFINSGSKIDFRKAVSKKTATQPGPKLTQKQTEEYRQKSYLCRDSLHLPGLQPKQRSNQIKINGDKVGIGDSLFVLLLRFVVAAKRNIKKGGWENPGFAPGKHQPGSNLRTAIQGSLMNKDGQKFIESDGSKQYRISTHPDFITYDRAQLLRHPLSSVKVLAKKLPK